MASSQDKNIVSGFSVFAFAQMSVANIYLTISNVSYIMNNYRKPYNIILYSYQF